MGTRKCPHNLNRPHFPGVFSYECPHKSAGVRARLCVYVFFWGGGGGGTLTFRRVVEKREPPDFTSLEVGILI